MTIVTRLDESQTCHFELGLTEVFKLYILTMVELTKFFRIVFWIRQIELLQVSLKCKIYLIKRILQIGTGYRIVSVA